MLIIPQAPQKKHSLTHTGGDGGVSNAPQNNDDGVVLVGGSDSKESPSKQKQQTQSAVMESPSVSETTLRLLSEKWAKEEIVRKGINFYFDDQGIDALLGTLNLVADNA